jgi:hypothetical protein
VKEHQAAELRAALLQLRKGGPEEQAVAAGEIDAVVDHSRSNIILFPAARVALRAHAKRISAAECALVTNKLLDALPRAEQRRLQRNLEPVTVRLGAVLHESGQPVAHVYFPIDSVVCPMATAENLQAVAAGLTGYEGVVGIGLALESTVAADRALVVISGRALRVEAGCFQQALRHSPVLQRELRRYAYGKLGLVSNTVACNCFHSAEARLARWLLMISDRARSPAFFFTQTALSDMLGLRRCTVTLIAGHLQRRNLIAYARGHIRILDRKGLADTACACFTGIEGANAGVPT